MRMDRLFRYITPNMLPSTFKENFKEGNPEILEDF